MSSTSESDKSLPALVSELWDLVVAYAKQETVDPLKRLGRFAKYGLAGSLLLGAGFVLLALAGLRALQGETGSHWTGNWSWAPYLITTAGAILVAIVLGLRITADRRQASRRRRRGAAARAAGSATKGA